MTPKGKLRTSIFAAAALAALAVIADGVMPGPLPPVPEELEPDFGITYCAPVDPNVREVSAITLPDGTAPEKPSCIPLPDDGRPKARPLPPAAPNPALEAPRTLSL
jgi:hypothetical protein